MNRWLAVVLLLVTAAGVAAQTSYDRPAYNADYEEQAPWQEQHETEPPAYPQPENLREFYVSAVATNTYFIDASTLAVGSDGVVRYVLVVRTAGGASNVSFEGIHCQERRWKHYATGHSGGTWTKSRASRNEWRPIENKPVNRHHAAISRDLFCPGGAVIGSADEGRNALRLGKHPNAN
jgi:hypothetical protein